MQLGYIKHIAALNEQTFGFDIMSLERIRLSFLFDGVFQMLRR